MWYFITFILGTIIGSFLNVVIYRLPRKKEGLSLVEPVYSFCPHCKAKIRWYDNIPLASYLILKGRCRTCGSRISPRYFLVELINSLGYAVNLWIFRNNIAEFFAMCLMLSCVIVIAFIDLEFMLMPDLALALIGLACFVVWLYSYQKVLNLLAGGVVSSLFLLLSVLYKGGMGSGDVILAGFMGITVGLMGSFYALIIASLTALGYAAMKSKGNFDRKQKVPFGTFLGPAFYFVIIAQRTWPWM